MSLSKVAQISAKQRKAAFFDGALGAGIVRDRELSGLDVAVKIACADERHRNFCRSKRLRTAKLRRSLRTAEQKRSHQRQRTCGPCGQPRALRSLRHRTRGLLPRADDPRPEASGTIGLT